MSYHVLALLCRCFLLFFYNGLLLFYCLSLLYDTYFRVYPYFMLYYYYFIVYPGTLLYGLLLLLLFYCLSQW